MIDIIFIFNNSSIIKEYEKLLIQGSIKDIAKGLWKEYGIQTLNFANGDYMFKFNNEYFPIIFSKNDEGCFLNFFQKKW